MLTTITKVYYDEKSETESSGITTHHFTTSSEELNNKVYLINSCGDYTEYGEVPKHIENWFNQIGLDFTHFPTLAKLWGVERNEYAFNLCYEIRNERDMQANTDYAVALEYDAQLKLLQEAARQIAVAIPNAIVRLSEMSGCSEQHELEIVFLYPCEPESILAAYKTLESQFDYVWEIGVKQ